MAAPTVKLTVNAGLDGVATIAAADAPASGSAGNVRRFNNYNIAQLLTGSTTPKVNQWPADLSHTLAGASQVFDLTAVPDARDINDNLDLTGDDVVALLVKAAIGNNAAGVTIDADPTNGYDIFGSGGSVIVFPGQLLVMSFIDADTILPAVAAGAKRIRFQGTAADVWEAILYSRTP